MNLKNMTADKLVLLYQNKDLSATEVISGVFEEIDQDLLDQRVVDAHGR